MQARLAGGADSPHCGHRRHRTQESGGASFDSNGIRLRYIEAGKGTPVILVPGYTRAVENNWIDTGVFANLAKDHRVIAYDLPGHGKSGKPHILRPMQAWGAIQSASWITSASDAHILLGYSLGGAIALRVAVTHPERFITLMSGGHSGLREWETADGEFYEKDARELEERCAFSIPGVWNCDGLDAYRRPNPFGIGCIGCRKRRQSAGRASPRRHERTF